MVLKAQLTFVHKENDVEYGEAASPSNSPSIPASPSLSCPSFAGTVDPKVYTLEKVNAIAAWLLDPARCPTQWATLINIRTAHAMSMVDDLRRRALEHDVESQNFAR